MSSSLLRRLSLWSIFVGIVILGLKVVAWQVTGSVALFSDAMESIVNVAASFMVFYAIRLSQKPADDNHPFGHFKAEYLSAVVEGVLIIFAAFLIGREAFFALSEPRAMDAPALGIAINLCASVLNGAWGYVLVRFGRRARSPALVADGHHLWSDVVTSVGVVFGLVLALATGWLWLDPLMAMIVAFAIVAQGIRLISSSFRGLMDGAMSPEDTALVRSIIDSTHAGALEYHDLKTREAGVARFIEFHLVVSSGMTVNQAHEICDRIEHALGAALPGARVTIHVEPEHKAKLHARKTGQ